MNDRQKNFNSRGLNFPYIQRPPYRSSGKPSISKPEEIAEYEEIAEPEEIAEFEGMAESEERVELEEAFEPEEIFEPEKIDEPEEVAASEEMAAPEEADAPEETDTYEESDVSEEAEIPEEADEPAAVENISIHDTDKLEEDVSTKQDSLQIASDILDEINTADEFETEIVTEVVTENVDETDPESSASDIQETEKRIETSEEIQAASIEISNKKKDKEKRSIFNEDIGEIPSIDGLYGRGLFHYKKWWFRCKIEISVNGQLICGIPIFTDHNTLRVVNEKHSYFIPVEKIDYIRTSDGLNF